MSWASKIKAVAAIAGAKAKEFDDKHKLSEKADAVGRKVSAKAKELDDKHRISESATKAIEKGKQLCVQVDEKHRLSEKAKAFDEKHSISRKASKTVDALKQHAVNIDNKVGITDAGYNTKIQRAKKVDVNVTDEGKGEHVEADEADCPICLEAVCAEHPAPSLVCGHDFHDMCLQEWLKSSPHCPLCRERVEFVGKGGGAGAGGAGSVPLTIQEARAALLGARQRVHSSPEFKKMQQAGHAAAKLASAFLGGVVQAMTSSAKSEGNSAAMQVGCSVCGCIMEVTSDMENFQCPSCSCILQFPGR